jgi:DNA-binding transcriptional MocR family regulator
VLIKSASQPLAEQLAARLAERIQTGLLASGARLPSVRQCAQQQGVSPSTVVTAYDQLQAQGLVEVQRNRGFYIRNRAVAQSEIALSAPEFVSNSTAHAPLSAAALIRGMFQGGSGLPQPGLGAFPPDWLETSFLTAAVRRVASGRQLQAMSLQYGEPAGDMGLRQALAARLNTLAISAAPSQIITTVGATHALDIVSRTLLRAGDCVMVEEPGWAIEFARLDALGMRILPVPRAVDGPDLAVMARYCELHAPKLFVSVSVLHNTACYSWPVSTTFTSLKTTPTATWPRSTPPGCARWTGYSAPSTSAVSPRFWHRAGALAFWPRRLTCLSACSTPNCWPR